MIEPGNKRKYDLEERTFKFSQMVIKYVNELPKSIPNIEIGRQLVRAGCSVGANYIEANESLGEKDFLLRIRTSRKEAKEARYWLMLSEPSDKNFDLRDSLAKEAGELVSIFGAIIKKRIENTK